MKTTPLRAGRTEAAVSKVDADRTTSPALSPVMARLLKKAEKQLDGRTIWTGSPLKAGDTRRLLAYGIPFPSLALAWGMGSNVWPGGRVSQFVGLPYSGKSILAADVARWVLELCQAREDVVPLIPGTVVYQENEIKKALDLVWSILEHRPEYDGAFCLEESRVMDDWVRNLLQRFKEWPQLFDRTVKGGADNPGWVVPLVAIVDSLCGTQTQQAVDKALEDLAIDQAHARRANALTNLAGVLPNCIGQRPIWFIATNHLKEYPDPNGNPRRNVPGGRAFQHIESTELELRKIADLRGGGGFTTSIKFAKNCFGESRRKVEVDVRWTHTIEEVDGASVKVQWTMIDWPTADVKFLEGVQARDPETWAKVAEHLDLNVTQGRIWSDALGIPQKGRLTRHEAGCVLNENGPLLDKIMPLLGITMGRMFLPGDDYQVEAYRVGAPPDPMSRRPYRRPTCGALTGLVRSGGGDGV